MHVMAPYVGRITPPPLPRADFSMAVLKCQRTFKNIDTFFSFVADFVLCGIT